MKINPEKACYAAMTVFTLGVAGSFPYMAHLQREKKAKMEQVASKADSIKTKNLKTIDWNKATKKAYKAVDIDSVARVNYVKGMQAAIDSLAKVDSLAKIKK